MRLVWNHRWEHDKDPEAFFEAVDQLANEGHDFEVVVCGESFRQEPAEFQAAAARHPERIVHMGFLEMSEYRRHLVEADVVVSTALHEFFGISVVEGVAAGCFPVLPRRLSYPEFVPPEYHADCLYDDGELVDRLRWAITHPDEARAIGANLAPKMARFDWSVMASRYDLALASLAGGMVAK